MRALRCGELRSLPRKASDTGKKNARDNQAAELSDEGGGGRFASMQAPGAPRLATKDGKPAT
jgi:hypothetical protein